MVICVHVSNYYCRGYGLGEVSGTSYVVSVVWNSVSRVAVPIFFMMSGALLLSKPIDIRKSLKRVGRTMVTLLLWSGIYYIWNLLYRDRLYDLSMIIEEPVKKHLWFLYAIIGLYLMVPFIQTMVQNLSDALMLCFVFIWFAILSVEYVCSVIGVQVAYPVPLMGESCYFGYFVLGYIIKEKLSCIPLTRKMCIEGAFLAMAAVMIVTCLCSWFEKRHIDKMFENRNILVAIASALIFCAALQYENYSQQMKTILHFLSRHTFTIYLCHVIFIDIVKLEFAPRTMHAVWGIPCYTVFVLIGSLLFSMVWMLFRERMVASMWHIQIRR